MKQMSCKNRVGGVTLLAASFAVISLAQSGQPTSSIPSSDSRLTKIVTTDSQLPLPHFANLTDWEKRKAFLRSRILVASGMSPMPPRTPLNAQIFGKTEGKGYTIEKVLLETLPGFYLGANLYRPSEASARHPAILNPHGHWPYGRLENTDINSGPALGISLARQGYVVLAIDMVGYTDTVQIPHRFGSPEQRLWSFGPLALQMWDAERALDFLASLPDVDPTRIGATGASGGGTQTFLLSAVDDRIAFSSPVNMISDFMQGGDPCENAPGLRFDTSNVEIAAMFAPKPMLVVSDTTDWTRHVPTEEFPAIQRIYALYGKENRTEVVQFEAVHNYNQQSREAVYTFFNKVNPGVADAQELKEHDISVPSLQDLMATVNRPLPNDAVNLEGLFHEWREMAEQQNAEEHDSTFLRERLLQTLGVENPVDPLSDMRGRQITLSRKGRGDRVTGTFISGTGEMAILIDPKGANGALKTEAAAQLQKSKRPILAVDIFSPGKERGVENTAEADPMLLTFNVTPDQARVQDILTAIAWASNNGRKVELYASGDAAIWAVFAAAVSDVQVGLHLKATPSLKTETDYLDHFNVPGILRAGGIEVASKLADVH